MYVPEGLPMMLPMFWRGPGTEVYLLEDYQLVQEPPPKARWRVKFIIREYKVVDDAPAHPLYDVAAKAIEQFCGSVRVEPQRMIIGLYDRVNFWFGDVVAYINAFYGPPMNNPHIPLRKIADH